MRWLVIIARDRPALWVTWAAFYGGMPMVKVLLDRREGQPWTERGNQPDRRTPPPRDTALQARGFLVLGQPQLVRTSA